MSEFLESMEKRRFTSIFVWRDTYLKLKRIQLAIEEKERRHISLAQLVDMIADMAYKQIVEEQAPQQ